MWRGCGRGLTSAVARSFQGKLRAPSSNSNSSHSSPDKVGSDRGKTKCLFRRPCEAFVSLGPADYCETSLSLDPCEGYMIYIYQGINVTYSHHTHRYTRRSQIIPQTTTQSFYKQSKSLSSSYLSYSVH